MTWIYKDEQGETSEEEADQVSGETAEREI